MSGLLRAIAAEPTEPDLHIETNVQLARLATATERLCRAVEGLLSIARKAERQEAE